MRSIFYTVCTLFFSYSSGCFLALYAQSYTSYFTGSAVDFVGTPLGGICLMGGGVEDDEAMRWFLQRAQGGDVLVLRASGSDGYNSYLYSDLGVVVNSVETIVCHSAAASQHPYVLQRIAQAEAIWLAGGDQWKYVSYWRGTAVDSLINAGIQQRNIVIGGTSAGMAVMGQWYFTAQYGTVSSATALANPYATAVALSNQPFIENALLQDVITDTHFDNPDRRGRLAVFLARIVADGGNTQARAIACEERTAVCITPNGMATVYGRAPLSDDNAYFIQTNCELPEHSAEQCVPGAPLHWLRGEQALKVYRLPGTNTGFNTFNLNNWRVGFGGTWLHWYVNNGTLQQDAGSPPNCTTVSSTTSLPRAAPQIWPTPCAGMLHINLPTEMPQPSVHIRLVGTDGRIWLHSQYDTQPVVTLHVEHLPTGLYLLQVQTEQGWSQAAKLLRQ